MSVEIPKNEEELLKSLQERWEKVEANFTALSELVEKAQAVEAGGESDTLTVDREMFLVLRGLADLTVGEAFMRLIMKQKAAEARDKGNGSSGCPSCEGCQ